MKYRYHPIAETAYFLSVILLPIITLHPILITLSLLSSVMLALLCKAQKISGKILFSFAVILTVSLTNPLFSHNGATALFFIEDIAITSEALIYGIFLGIALTSTFNLFSIFSACLDSERIYALFGNISHNFALVFSMTLHLLPTLKRKFSNIIKASKVSGEFDNSTPFITIKSYLNCFSILITYAMESGIERSDSMKARGYGVCKRSFYTKYDFKRVDSFACAYIASFDILCVILTVKSGIYSYYPLFVGIPVDIISITLYLSFGALCILPILLHAFYELTLTNHKKTKFTENKRRSDTDEAVGN